MRLLTSGGSLTSPERSRCDTLAMHPKKSDAPANNSDSSLNKEDETTRSLRRAVALAQTGDWSSAHEIVQDLEGNEIAAWIHAVVHRMEGDLDNARYWYGRCRRELRSTLSTQAELKEIEALLRG